MQKNDDAEPNTIDETEAMNYHPWHEHQQRIATKQQLDESLRKSLEKYADTLIALSSR